MSKNLNEKVFNNSDEYFSHLLSDIKSARKSVDIEVYIFNHDLIGKKIIDALIQARKQRKIKIRLLIDGVGTAFWAKSLVKSLKKHGIKTRVYNPCPWRVWQWKISAANLPFLLNIFYFILKINSRNHRKSIIIDNSIAYFGSMNIDQRHLSKCNGGQSWRDTAVRMQNINLSKINNAFNSAWENKNWHKQIDKVVTKINSKFRINNTWKRRYMLYKSLLRKLAKAKSRIWITNPYFIPNRSFISLLKKIAAKGVDVCIVLPKKSDLPFMNWAMSCFYEDLIHSKVKIYEYDGKAFSYNGSFSSNKFSLSSLELLTSSVM